MTMNKAVNRSRKPSEAQREERRKYVAANLLGGLTYREMAAALNVSLGTIAKDVSIIISRWQREQLADIDEAVRLEATRLDRALNAVWNKVIDGDNRAINIFLKIEERRAKLLGLDASDRLKTKDDILQVLNIDVSNLTDEQLERITNGESPLAVLAASSQGGTRTA